MFGFIGYNGVRVSDQSSGISSFDTPLGLTNDRSAGTLASIAGVSTTQIDPAALALLNFKLPNGAYLIPSQQAASTMFGETTLLGKPYFSADQAVADLDWNLSPKDVLSAKYFYQHDPAIAPYVNSSTDGFAQHLDSGAHVAALTNAFTPTPRINWTQVLGFAREKAYSTDDQALTPQQAGINLFGSTFFPGISIRDFSSHGNTLSLGNTSTFNRTGVFQNRLAPNSDVIISLGKNTLTAGAGYTYTQLDIRNRRTDSADISFSNFRSFVEGAPRVGTNTELLLGASSRYYRAQQVGGYVQDKFRLPRISP